MRYLLLLSACLAFTNSQQVETKFNYKCNENGACRRGTFADGVSLSRCKLTCDPSLVLWPKPRGKVDISTAVSEFSAADIELTAVESPSEKVTLLVREAYDIFLGNLKVSHPLYKKFGDSVFGKSNGNSVGIKVTVAHPIVAVTNGVDESFTLAVQTAGAATSVVIVAETFLGARHALETLSQLMRLEDTSNMFLINEYIAIIDSPAYKVRGFCLDTSRHYYSVESIKKILDGMSYIKMNHFHWHISDSNSFPFISKRQPEMAEYGADSPYHVYSADNIVDIVHYAEVRGIRVVPEIDAPAHAGYGWQWKSTAGCDMVYCLSEEPWNKWCVQPPCGQLNPLCSDTYEVLGDIYKDLAEVFTSDLWHVGGDEISKFCWNDPSVAPETAKWLEENGGDILKLWGDIYQKESFARLKNATNKIQKTIIWSNDLTDPANIEKYLNKDDYIVQYWGKLDDAAVKQIIDKGYEVIFSNYDAWYMDCGYGNWVNGEGPNWCSPYKDWTTVYLNDLKVASGGVLNEKILGGVINMFGELVDEGTVEGKVFPRLAAAAERLWSDPTETWEGKNALWRLLTATQRMQDRGIKADPIQPFTCYLDEGSCPAGRGENRVQRIY